MGEPDFSEWIDFDHKNTQMFVMFSCGGLVAGCQAPPNSCNSQNGVSYDGKCSHTLWGRQHPRLSKGYPRLSKAIQSKAIQDQRERERER